MSFRPHFGGRPLRPAGPRELIWRLAQLCRRRRRELEFRLATRRRRDGGSAGGVRADPELWQAARARLAPGARDLDERLAALGRGGGEWIDALRAEAEAMMEGRFCLLGHERIGWGSPPDWRREPIRGRSFAEEGFCWRVAPLDEATYGDAKLVWELHRLQWLVRAAFAWRATEDARIGDWVGLCLDDWLARVPAWCGIAWSSALEVALRGFSLAWLLALAGAEWGESRPERVARLGSVLAASRRHVAENLSRYFAPNTHLLGELAWLACSGWIWRGALGNRRASGRHAYRALAVEAVRQTLADGAHYEGSTWYHRYALELYMQVLLTGRASGQTAAELEPVARQLLAAAALLAGGDGWPPAFGDDDGGRLWPWRPGPPTGWDWRGLLELGRHLGLGGGATSAGSPGIESFVLLGRDRAGSGSAPAVMSPCAGARAGAADVDLLPAAGWAVLRDSGEAGVGGGPRQLRVAADFGAVGPRRTRAGHGHEDVASFELWLDAERWIVDRGTGDYMAGGRRREYRAAASHNVIDWPSQPQATGERLFVRDGWIEGSIVGSGACPGAAWVAGRWHLRAGEGWGMRVLVLARGAALLGLDAICREDRAPTRGTWRLHAPGSLDAAMAGGRVRLRRGELGAELALGGPLFAAGLPPRLLRRAWAPAYGAAADGWVVEADARDPGGAPTWGGWLLAWRGAADLAVAPAGEGVVALATAGDWRLAVGWGAPGISLVSAHADGTNARAVNPESLPPMLEMSLIGTDAPIGAADRAWLSAALACAQRSEGCGQ